MGALISLLARFLGGALTSVIAWIAAAVGSEGLMRFLAFSAKIAFMLALAASTVAYVTPLAASLNIGGLGQHALWMADQIQFAYVFTVVMTAYVYRWAVGWVRSIL